MVKIGGNSFQSNKLIFPLYSLMLHFVEGFLIILATIVSYNVTRWIYISGEMSNPLENSEEK